MECEIRDTFFSCQLLTSAIELRTNNLFIFLGIIMVC